MAQVVNAPHSPEDKPVAKCLTEEPVRPALNVLMHSDHSWIVQCCSNQATDSWLSCAWENEGIKNVRMSGVNIKIEQCEGKNPA